MKLTMNQKVIGEFCASDKFATSLKDVYYDASVNSFIATDGHVLVQIENFQETSDESFIIPLECFPEKKNHITTIEKIEKHFEVKTYQVSKYGAEFLVHTKIIPVIEERFANWKNVIPENFNPIEYIGLNPSFITKFEKLNKCFENSELGIRMHFTSEKSGIIIEQNVEKSPYKGLLMPIKLSK